MKRLIQSATNAAQDIFKKRSETEYGKFITYYEDEKNENNYGAIFFDKPHKVFNIFINSISNPIQKFYNDKDNINLIFSEVEQDLINDLKSSTLRRWDMDNKGVIKVKDSLTWQTYKSNNKQKDAEDRTDSDTINDSKQSKIKTIEFFINNEEGILNQVRDFITKAVTNDYISSYSITPLKVEKLSSVKNKKAKKAKIIISRLKRIVEAYAINSFLRDFEIYIPSFSSIIEYITIYYSNENVQDQNDSSSTGFIIMHNNLYIAFGPQADQEINQMVDYIFKEYKLDNYDYEDKRPMFNIERFHWELEQGNWTGFSNIKQFRSFDEAEEWLLGLTNGLTKSRINLKNDTSIENSIHWENYVKNTLNLQVDTQENKDEVNEENNIEPEDIVDNIKSEDPIVSDQEKESIEKYVEFILDTLKNADDKKDQVKKLLNNSLRVRIHYFTPADKIINKWIDNNSQDFILVNRKDA